MNPDVLFDLLLKWEENHPFVKEVPHKAGPGEAVFRIDVEGNHFRKLQFLREVNAPEHQILTVEIDQQIADKDLITMRIRVTFTDDDFKLEYALGKTPQHSTADIWELGQTSTDLLKGGSRQMMVPKLNLSPITRENNFRQFDDPNLLKIFV
jgi:hypothetical protein